MSAVTSDGPALVLLERILSLDSLRWAWHRVRGNKGIAGGDGVTLARFARLLDANLLALADEVRAGSYRPGTMRRLRLRKGHKLRLISVLPVRDRVLQRATLDAIGPLVEPLFHPGSFGYRPHRSLHDAVARIVRLRDRGLCWVIDADIRDCFGTLDHDLLRQFLARVLPDADLQRLLAVWIAWAGADVERGIPQGAVVSPLFCNIYLHHLDEGLRRRRLQIVRYADDFVVLCKSREHARWALRALEKVMGGLRLELHPQKTQVVSFDEGFDFLGVHFEGTDYSYLYEGKRITVDVLPPEFFHYHADGYE